MLFGLLDRGAGDGIESNHICGISKLRKLAGCRVSGRYGRGAGVGRGRGDGPDLGVGVVRGVAVGVTVAVVVALGVGVGDDVGVGVGLEPSVVTSRNAALTGPQV